ncbi:hypothetical protein BDA99DRAFT_554932 [Phascolomyces articulosus]|uniref:Uncharacterized protein n=1 Tax=Phascolomyces articulosus TaxID=60185 RepID=A0AAD5KW33_9FUNG|nr:hypothetical protein BDA99DRAFT_554932 [Phascolomyces articulosus]
MILSNDNERNKNYYNEASQDLNVRSLLFKFKLIDPSSQWNSTNEARAKLWTALEDSVSTIMMGILAILQYAADEHYLQQNRPYHTTTTTTPWLASYMIYITQSSVLLSSIVRSLTDALRQHAQEMNISYTHSQHHNKSTKAPLSVSSKLLMKKKPYRLLETQLLANDVNNPPMYFKDKIVTIHSMAQKLQEETNSILQLISQVEQFLLSLQDHHHFQDNDSSHSNNFESCRQTIQKSLITHTNQLVEALLEFSASPSIIIIEKKFAQFEYHQEQSNSLFCINNSHPLYSTATTTKQNQPTCSSILQSDNHTTSIVEKDLPILPQATTTTRMELVPQEGSSKDDDDGLQHMGRDHHYHLPTPRFNSNNNNNNTNDDDDNIIISPPSPSGK